MRAYEFINENKASRHIDDRVKMQRQFNKIMKGADPDYDDNEDDYFSLEKQFNKIMNDVDSLDEYKTKFDDKYRPAKWHDAIDDDNAYWDNKTGNSYYVLRLDDNIWGYVIGNGWNKVFWGKHKGNLKIKDHPSITGAGQIFHDLLSKGFEQVNISASLGEYKYIVDHINKASTLK